MKIHKDAYITSELANILGVTVMTITRRAKRESWQSRPRAGRGGGNEWLVASMPEEVRLTIAQFEAEEAACKLNAGELLEELSLPAIGKGAVSSPVNMSDAQRLRAESRGMIVRIFEAWRQMANLPLSRARSLFCELYNEASEQGLQVPEWVRESVPHVSANSIYNWSKKLKESGVGDLGGKHGQHRKGSGIIDQNEEMRELIVGLLYKYPHTSGKNVMRALEARFSKNERPSMRTLLRWMSSYREMNQSLIMKSANPDGWRSKYMSAAGSASAHIERLNQVWEYDSTVADVMLADGKRHAIIGIIDVWSRRVKFLVSRTSKTSAIKALTRQCILDWGVPEVAKTDNGQDYVSKEFNRSLLWLKIEHQLCPPFSPEKKPHIERVFKTFLHGVFEYLEGFVGHNVVDRKAIESRKAFSARLFKKENKDTPVELRITPEELQAFCDHWTQNMYEHEVHGSLGVTPFAKAASWRGVVSKFESEEAERSLDILLSPAAGNEGWRTVGKKGLKVDGYYYDHPALRIESEVPAGRVQVLLDETDAGYVFCFNENGDFVCRAMCPELLGISREALAQACKKAQRQYLSGATRELSVAARRANVDTILSDIIASSSAKASKVSAMPQRTESYETDALTASGQAYAATQAPEQHVAPSIVERQELLKKRFAQNVTPMETPEQREARLKKERFERAVALEAKLEAKEEISDEDMQWLIGYRTQPEYLTQKRHMEQVQAFQMRMQKEIPVAQIG